MTVPAIALDLSVIATGMTLPDGTCRTLNDNIGPSRPIARLHDIVHRIGSRVEATRPRVAVLEGYGFNSKRLVRNVELGGAVRLLLYEAGIPIVEITPKSLKKWATDDGNADKDAMLAAARRFGADVANHNEADSWLLWAVAQQRYAFSRDLPLLGPLDALLWPELRRVA